jgi:hypothetical protein
VNRPSARTLRLATASAALLAVSAVSVGTLASTALFTATASSGPATVASGSVSLALGGTASTTLATSGMAPGDTRFGVVSVQNSGSLQARYSAAITWSSANELTSALTLSAKSIASAGATCDASLTWTSGNLATDVSAASGQTTAALFGNATAGNQTGDRTINAAATEFVCVRLALPAATGNTAASKTSNLSLDFVAEQTANNP